MKTTVERPLAAAIRKVREQAGMSPPEAANRLGVSTKWLREVESGTREPTVLLLRGLARLPGVTRESADRMWAAIMEEP